MKKYRILSLFSAAAVMLSIYGCDLKINTSEHSDSSSESEITSGINSEELPKEYKPIELETVREHAEKILEDVKVSGNNETIQQDIDALLNDIDTASEALAYINIAYYTDWNNEALEAEYNSCYETWYVASDIALYAFSNCYAADEYSDMFEDYIIPDSLEYYTNRSMSMKRIEGYAKVDCELMYENLDAYYDILYSEDEDADKDELNLKAAEIYLDILSDYNTETFYDNFNRDFSPKEVLALTDSIEEKIMPAYDMLSDVYMSMPGVKSVLSNPAEFENPFETIAEYAGNISPEIGEYAEKILKDEHYLITNGDNCYTGSFTIDLPLENDALIYVYNNNDYFNLLTPIHEFGHYYSSFYDDIPSFIMENNIDIAEIQSQGMEMLFMNQYDDIYGKQADAMKVVKILDMIDSVISGFAVGEFEYTVLENIDDMTPQDVLDTFNETMAKYNYEVDLYYISHLFEQPGYYISYGVSALAAMDIWLESLENFDNAVAMYDNIAQVSINSGELQFKSALSSCGFSDVLNEDYITLLAEKVTDYAEELQ